MSTAIRNRSGVLVLASGAAFALGGCLGSSGGDDGPPSVGTDLDEYAVSGEVSGLGPGALVIDFNGESISVDEDGEFEIADSVEEGTEFELSVAEAPEGPLQSCSISPSSGQVTADMQVEVLCVTPVAISGRVSSSYGAGSSVKLTAGDQSFNSDADEDGLFEFEVEVADPWTVLSLDASEGEWHFRSHLGSLAGLSERRGLPVDDGQNFLGESQTGRVNLNHFNTAIAGQLEWIIDADSFDDDELREASLRLQTREAANIAGALRLVTEADEVLPEYADNTLSVAREHEKAILWTRRISDGKEEAETASLSTIHFAEPLTAAVSKDLKDSASIAMDEATVESEGISELPEFMFITSGHTWNEPVYAAKLDFVASNVWLRDTTGEIGPGYHSLSNGDLLMDFSGVEEPFREHFVFKTLPGNSLSSQVLAVDYLLQAEVEHLMDGYAGEFVRQKLRIRREYPDNDDLETENVTETSFVLLMPQGGNVVLDESEIAGELNIGFPAEKWEQKFVQEWDENSSYEDFSDVADLQAGGSGALLRAGTPFSWSISSEGALNVRPTDGNEHYRVWMVNGDSSGEGLAIVDGIHDNMSPIAAGYQMRRPKDIWFTPQDIHGRWKFSELLDDGEPAWIVDYDESTQILYIGRESHTDVSEFSWVENSPYRVEFGSNPGRPVMTMAQCWLVGSDWVRAAPAEVGLPAYADEGSCADALAEHIPSDELHEILYVERAWQVLDVKDGVLHLNEQYRQHQATVEPGSESTEWDSVGVINRGRKYEYIGEPEL